MTRTVSLTRTFAATPERVFDAWLDPAQVRRFLFATPDGEVQTVETDARSSHSHRHPGLEPGLGCLFPGRGKKA
jgi:uncharacterized protein YndB with AHSA1/START domain